MSTFIQRCNSVKTHSYAFILGSLVSAFGGYNYLGQQVAHFQDRAASGLCGHRDVEYTFYWSECVPSVNPDAEIQAGVINDRDNDEILADMRRKQNGGRRK